MDKTKPKSKKKSPETNKTVNYCDICNKNVIGSSYKFKAHLFNHRAVKARFNCQYCYKEFFRSDAYDRHVSMHTGDYKKLYTCDHCDRSFVDKRNLIKHLKIHDDNFLGTNAVSYDCLDCDASYAEERCLKYHVQRHHYNLEAEIPVFANKPLNETWVERVLNSNSCVQVKKLNNNVITIKSSKIKKESSPKMQNKYMKYMKSDSDTTQYSKAICDYCKKEMLKKSLRVHIIEKHLKVRKFKCETCNKSFKRQYQMTNHACGLARCRRSKKLVPSL